MEMFPRSEFRKNQEKHIDSYCEEISEILSYNLVWDRRFINVSPIKNQWGHDSRIITFPDGGPRRGIVEERIIECLSQTAELFGEPEGFRHQRIGPHTLFTATGPFGDIWEFTLSRAGRQTAWTLIVRFVG